VDVHGAGAQRGDPKVAPPYTYATNIVVVTNGTTYTGYSFGPQGDAIRGFNYVRLVRDGNNSCVDHVGDGIPDWWRRQYFGGAGTTTNSQSCAACDIEPDGLNNLQEYLAGTDPTNAASRLAVVAIAQQTNGVEIVWVGGTAVTQVVETRHDLCDTNDVWVGWLTNTPPTAITNLVLCQSATATNVFFRIKTWR